jgi:hypothetical protein
MPRSRELPDVEVLTMRSARVCSNLSHDASGEECSVPQAVEGPADHAVAATAINESRESADAGRAKK